jgi:hypothetical protein
MTQEAEPKLGFADAAIEFARKIAEERPADLEISLAGIRVQLWSTSSFFLNACRTALINDPTYADKAQEPLRVVVADRQIRPDAPRAESDREVQIVDQMARSRHFAAYLPDFDQWQFLDWPNRLGVEIMPHPDAYPPWEDSFPLLQFLHWTAMVQGRRILHAASLGVGARGVLLAGDSGVGKSGTVLAGLLGGLSSIGDDYVLVEQSKEAVRGFPLTRIMKQDAAGLMRNGIEPEDSRFSGPNWQGKYETCVAELASMPLPASLEICAIVLPQKSQAAGPKMERASGRDAMLALLPSNIMQLAGGQKYAAKFVASLVRRLPVFRLELGNDPRAIPKAVAGLMGELAP